MARLSVNDLNNLSGITDEELQDLYKEFRKAHTKVFNDIEKWIVLYDSKVVSLKKCEGKSKDNDIHIYKVARKMYYEATLILDSADMLSDSVVEYQGLLGKLRKPDSDIRHMNSLIKVKKKEIINRLSDCYGLYSEAYNRLEDANYE